MSKWRVRFARAGRVGLQDAPRPGAVRRYGPTTERQILAKLDEPPPSGYATCTGALLARALGDVSKRVATVNSPFELTVGLSLRKRPTVRKTLTVATGYAAQYPGERGPYNDTSLLWGGKFDGNSYNWTGGHVEHRVGTSADVNSCDFTILVQARIEFLFLFTGGAVSSLDECSTPYHTFHFRW